MADYCLQRDQNGGKIVPKRRAKPVEESDDAPSRSEQIAVSVGEIMDDMVNESLYWTIRDCGLLPTWAEIRDAVIWKLFEMEHEMGRQELHAEQVRENCI